MSRPHGFPAGNPNMSHLDREFFILDSQLIAMKTYLDLATKDTSLDISTNRNTAREVDRLIYDLIELKSRIQYLQGIRNEK